MHEKKIKPKLRVSDEDPAYPNIQSDDEADDEASTSSSNIVYLTPTTADQAADPSTESNDEASAGPSFLLDTSLVFHRSVTIEDIFIGPIAFLSGLMQKHNMLLIDIRRTKDFLDNRILIENHLGYGHYLNVSGDSFFSGLSVEIFGQLFEPEDQAIWEMRNTFDMVVLVDVDTHMQNYRGSKIEELRNMLIKWKAPHSQKPRVLSGGITEFADLYPTEVGNSYTSPSQTNSVVDELLSLDEVSYPETGAGPSKNLRLNSVNSIGNLESRIQRDFAELNPKEQVEARRCLSEGCLPVDCYSSSHNLSHLAGPFKCLSLQSIPAKIQIGFEPIEPMKPRTELEVPPKVKVTVRGDVSDEFLRRKASSINKSIHSERRKREYTSVRKSRSRNRASRRRVNDKPNTPKEKPNYSTPFGDGFCGLKNVKNICYINSILQCLKVLPVFKTTYVISDLHASITNESPNINPQFAQTLKEIWGGTSTHPKYYYIEPLKQRLCEINADLDKGTHEDAFEFLIFFFNLVSMDCRVELPHSAISTEGERAWFGHLQGRSSFLVDTFYYQLKNIKVCYNCRSNNLSFETDSTLMLSLSEEKCCLQAMVDEYVKDNLVPDYSCFHCKCTATIVNRKEITVNPDVLVIVLKRHIISPEGTSHKNESPVSFPLNDLKFGNATYDCYGVIQHSGDTGQGHYYATVLMDATTKEWLLFDDEQVIKQWLPVNKMIDVQMSAAGFFYVRRS